MTKLVLFFATTIFSCSLAAAQVPANAPAGTNGICKDGTYSNAPQKSGACAGHKGVQTWYVPVAAQAAPAPTPATKPIAAAPAPTPVASVPGKPAPTAASPAAAAGTRLSPAQTAAQKTAQPGGGPGLVWVNASSNVYHCYGDTFYGKTKQGAYMTEADAKAKGAHGDHGKTCGK